MPLPGLPPQPATDAPEQTDVVWWVKVRLQGKQSLPPLCYARLGEHVFQESFVLSPI